MYYLAIDLPIAELTVVAAEAVYVHLAGASPGRALAASLAANATTFGAGLLGTALVSA